MDIITLFLFGSGIYLIFINIKMKKTGEIPKALVSSKIKLERAKDIPGFINYMFIRGIIFGCIISAFSAITIIKDYMAIDSTVLFVMQIIEFVAIIYYMVVASKAATKYLF